VILVKRQTNGNELIVLKHNASVEDLEAAAANLQLRFGYEVTADRVRGTCKLSHPYYRGEFVLRLEPDPTSVP
jgi:hypothetical protein